MREETLVVCPDPDIAEISNESDLANIIKESANGQNKRRSKRVKDIEGRAEKVEKILFYLEQEYTEEDIRELIGTFLDKKTLDVLMLEALSIFKTPKPTEDRIAALESKCDDLYRRVDQLIDNVNFIKEAITELSSTINLLTRRKNRE